MLRNLIVEDLLEDARIMLYTDCGYTVNQDGHAVIDKLTAGDTVNVRVTYVVTNKDVLTGKVINTAKVEGDPIDGCVPSGGDTVIVDDIDDPDDVVPNHNRPSLNKKDHTAYIIGYEDGTVRPGNSITRAEVATIFFRLLDADSRAYYWSQTNDFQDVAGNDWFNNAVSTMARAHIIEGYPDGGFHPNASITRAEFAAIAARFSDVRCHGDSRFSDVLPTFWAKNEIALAEHLGWISGYPDGTFRPNRAITRAEAMTLINRVLERAVEREHMCSGMIQWKDNNPRVWYYAAVQEATNSHTYTRRSQWVPGQDFCFENWHEILKNPDWAALERTWSAANDQ